MNDERRSGDASGSPEQPIHAGDQRSPEPTGSPEQLQPSSTRAIAKVFAASQSTIARMNREMAAERAAKGAQVAYVRGLDGKDYPASREDRYGMVTVLVEAIKADPDASLRVIAKRIGCSPATVLRYRRWFEQTGKLDEWRSAESADSPAQQGPGQ